MTRRSGIVIEQDRSNGDYCVTEYHRHGWSVLSRHETLEEAQAAMRKICGGLSVADNVKS